MYSLYLPLGAVIVQCREEKCCFEQIDALFHSGDGVGAAISHRIVFPIVHISLIGPSFFDADKNEATHSVSQGSSTYIFSISLTFCFFIFVLLVFLDRGNQSGFLWSHGHAFKGSAKLIRGKYPSQIVEISSIIFKNIS